MPKFTVDTHLFRELGELLVGRDSTALIELIKNAYDADATEVTVYGEQLDAPGRGRIVVSDNGTGMTQTEFEAGFLRVASRLKERGDRRSAKFRRRFTGAKGIGRLAAHKLARLLEIDSTSEIPGNAGVEALHARIDWDKIEEYETIEDVNTANVIQVVTTPVAVDATRGTTLTLTNLRRAWTPTERARFFAEVQSFDPPEFLQRRLPDSVVAKPLLFETPVVRDEIGDKGGLGEKFSVLLEGEFTAGEDYWQEIAEAANWVIEIRAAPDHDAVEFVIAPTVRTRKENPEARPVTVSIPHPDRVNGPFFDARILIREGRLRGRGDQRVWASKTSGIRVYYEGFRVLPYGDPQDDWLRIDHDYTRRPRQLELLRDITSDLEATDPDEGLVRLPNNNYFGAVFLTQERAPSFRMLVNREGFVPEAGLDHLVDLIRTGVDLSTRVRAAAGYARRKKWKEDRSGKVGAEDKTPTEGGPESGLLQPLDGIAELLKRARTHMSAGDVKAAEHATKAAAEQLNEARESAADVISERALLRVLASVGTQMAAFVHEINALLGAAQTVSQALERLSKDRTLPKEHRSKLRQMLNASTELRQGLERQASYLTDVVTPDARRRRSRQRLAERFDAAVRLIQHQAERRRIEVINQIPSDLRSPPMFPAEVLAIFANLLTNALKASGEDGRIQAGGSAGDDGVAIRIQNTGVAVDLAEADRWFEPFESTTFDVEAVLGQGMGLGLTITRNLLESYGATITFVSPDPEYATAIKIAFPK